MARPQKVGIDYFPLDVDMDQDDKIAMIEAVRGIEGFGVVIKLLMKIYKEGYYYKWTEREQILFSKRINVDINRVNAIINDCIKWDLFDKELFNKYHILTSRGIQKRYLEAVKRRTSIELIQEFLLLTSCDIVQYKNIVFVDINGDNVNINLINDDINTQRKEKKSKEKKSKEKEDISLQIKNLRSRYSEEQLKVIDEYFDILRWTRKNGKIADSVILKIYQEWEKYPIPKVIYALKVYINNPKYHDKRENYCYGIMRNVTADEIAKGEDYGKSKRDNGQDVDQYAGIGLSFEDLQQL